MKNSIQTAKDKTLRLEHVLIREILTGNLKEERLTKEMEMPLALLVEQMESQLRAKGTQPVGPVIQYTDVQVDGNGEVGLTMELLRQCSVDIHKVDEGYRFIPSIRVSNCLYARYQGPEDKLQLAYQKLQILSFEEDIPLKGNNYTIFLDGDEDGNIVADVFMERADGN